jgi:uncharacterized protein YceK
MRRTVSSFGDWLLCNTKERKSKIRQTDASLIKVEDLEWGLNYLDIPFTLLTYLLTYSMEQSPS